VPARGRGLCARISQRAISHSIAATDCRTDAHAYPDRNAHARAYVYPKPYRHAYCHADCDADGDACATDGHACSAAHINTSPTHGYACAPPRHAGAGPAPVRACGAARAGVRHAG
jgi:hypothetical protein